MSSVKGTVTQTKSSGSFRRIEVRLSEQYGRSGADYTVRSRTGYYTRAADRTPGRP